MIVTREIDREKLRKTFKGIRSALDDLEQGLNEQPFTWGEHETAFKTRLLKIHGLTLLSGDALTKRGYLIKEGEIPVGKIWTQSPYGNGDYGLVYLVEVQTYRKPRKRKG